MVALALPTRSEAVMNKTTKSVYFGLTFETALTIVFIALKLLGAIDWRWIWVLSPIWISACIIALIYILVFVFYIVYAIIIASIKRKNIKH